MTKLVILSPIERNRFDCPPKLTPSKRIYYFSTNREINKIINQLRRPDNKVGFILQLGYFKASGKFFTAKQFNKHDIEYAANQLKIPIDDIDFSKYKERTSALHRQRILDFLSWQPFSETQQDIVSNHIRWFVEKQLSPKHVFWATVDICWQNKIEIPSYNIILNHITLAYNDYEEELLNTLKSSIKKDQPILLKEFISGKDNTPLQRPPLTLLKHANHSLKPSEIKSSLIDFNKIKDCYKIFEAIIDELSLSDNAVEYFATWVQKAQTFQVNQFKNKHKSYLYFLAYIKHQLYIRNDYLVDVYLKSVKASSNTAYKQLNEHEVFTRRERNKAIKALSSANKESRNALECISSIINTKAISEHEQLKQIVTIVKDYNKRNGLQKTDQVKEAESSLDHISKNKSYYDQLEDLSLRLQRRVGGIIKSISFDRETSDKALLEAVDHYKDRDGNLTQTPPYAFLKSDEIDAVKADKFRTSLYKAFLFIHIADGIKSGKLNLTCSYRFKSIQDFLIDQNMWKMQRDQLITSSGLENFKDVKGLLNDLKNQLDEKYACVNRRILNHENKDITIDESDQIKINTPRREKEDNELVSALLSDNRFIPILQILEDVNKATDFTECFKHHSIKFNKIKPTPNTIFAGVLGKGCNIGVNRIANISKGMSEDILLNTVNWCFDLKNIQDANNKIIGLIDKLSLAKSYRQDQHESHTSSDGTKINVAVDCLHANYSFKYFGKGKGVAMYTFVDDQQMLFYSTVISASEREAAYVIDGLLNNNVVKSTIHSTDTHGFTETIFAATNMIGVSFAPRLSKINSHTIYAFSAKSTYASRGYKILPSRRINQKLIEDNWDDILRFMATIKLKHSTASQLFTRLSSYAKEHPLYQALKELGRIYKSIFILSFYDDVSLRQKIEKQLNKVELSHKFSKAVFFANNREFKHGDKLEQNISTSCKMLIQNSIVLWNYLYLSQYLANIADKEDSLKIVNTIQRGSIMTWQHINLHGEYDFTRRSSNNSQFDVAQILKLKIPTVTTPSL